jgi:transmembrane sensor
MENLDEKYSKNRDSENVSVEEMILYRSSMLRVPGGRSKVDALAMLKTKAAALENKSIPLNKEGMRLKIWIPAAAAAAILLFMGLWRIFLHDPMTRITAENGSITHYRLPDGSAISLNAGSYIIFKKKEFTGDRLVNLEGEAFFDVEKGSTFTISTNKGSVKVLGTSFNVHSREYFFSVSCLSGKIQVMAGDKSVVIEPGQTAKLSGNDLISYQDNKIDNATGWLKGEFYFENTPLIQVFQEIERQFNVKFAGHEVNEEYFTGSFDTKDLNITLEAVCLPMGLKYEIGKNGKILIGEKTN